MGSTGVTDDPTDGDPRAADIAFPRLSRRQRALYERLVGYRSDLGQMYVGALVALASGGPDSIAHAAHSARELIEKLVELRAPAPPTRVGHPRDKGRELRNTWTSYRIGQGPGFDLEQLQEARIDRRLVTVLRKVDEFAEAQKAYNPGRKAKTERALDELGLSDGGLPAPLRKAEVDEWHRLRQLFEAASHHGPATADEVSAALGDVERFLMRWIPETFDDFDELDRLIEGDDDA